MKRLTLFVAGLALLVALRPGVLRAEIDPILTLQDLVEGDSITVVDKLFDNWEITENFGSFLVDPSQIDVTPVADDPLNPGVKFTNNTGGVSIGQTSTLGIAFSVETVSGLPLIKDNSLTLDQFSLGDQGFAFVAVNESVFDGPPGSGNSLGQKTVRAARQDGVPTAPDELFDELTFSPLSKVYVQAIIEVDAGGGSSASLDMFTMRFSQVPEPASLLLGGIALAAFMSYAWRRRRNGL